MHGMTRRPATDPSPGPCRLARTPVAAHPLPTGEAKWLKWGVSRADLGYRNCGSSIVRREGLLHAETSPYYALILNP
jgi:hypothetical protein